MKPSVRRKIGAVLVPLIWFAGAIALAVAIDYAVIYGYAAGVLPHHFGP